MQKPNWDEMTREDAIALLKKVRNALIGIESANDAIIDISEMLGVSQRCGEDNEYDEEDA
jgi:hypothetical protein